MGMKKRYVVLITVIVLSLMYIDKMILKNAKAEKAKIEQVKKDSANKAEIEQVKNHQQ